jgi:hypothetical protein
MLHPDMKAQTLRVGTRLGQAKANFGKADVDDPAVMIEDFTTISKSGKRIVLDDRDEETAGQRRRRLAMAAPTPVQAQPAVGRRSGHPKFRQVGDCSLSAGGPVISLSTVSGTEQGSP